MNLAILDWTIIGPAFLAGILVISTHVPLGQEVLRRGIIFIDLAVAQVAGLGVIAADIFIGETQGIVVQIAAVTSALLAAALLNWTEKHWLEHQEAIIGTLFILAATASILLLAGNPHGGEYLKDLLVGQILWSTWESLLPTALLYGVLLGVWFTTRDKSGRLVFYVTFSFAVTASVQLVGIYLVFASLIIPSLSTIRMQGHKRLWVGYALGAASYLTGIMLSAMLDFPTGAIIVWSMAMLGLITAHMIKLTSSTNQIASEA